MKTKNIIRAFLLSLLILTVLSGCGKATEIHYTDYLTLTATYPHNQDSFTQGLFFHNGMMYESTGRYGYSAIMKNISIENGMYEKDYRFDSSIFGEGSVVLNNKLYMLTWKENRVFVINPDILAVEKELPYSREGWGLTTDGRYLIASDGSSSLYFMDEELNEVKTLTVTVNGEEASNLNELEFVDGFIWANVWMSDEILVIDKRSGKAVKVIEFGGLREEENADPNDVLNGIAYNPETEKIYITGKRWDTLYEFETK